VFFFLSAGWGPVVRALPIMNRLADYGVASSFAVGGLTDSKIRDMGFDPIEISVPPLDTSVVRVFTTLHEAVAAAVAGAHLQSDER